MNYIIVLMSLIGAQLHKGISWNSEGTEFITAFMQNYIPSSSYSVQLSISVTALNPSTSVYIIIYNTSFEVSLTLEEWETADVPLPAAVQLLDTVVSSNSTVIVRSNKPITVLSINYEQYTADTSTIFPVDALGTEYFVFAPREVEVWNSFMSQFVIINYNQTNDILVTVAGSINYNGLNYSLGDNLTIVLSAFETIQLQSSSILTGTRIQSQYPIAVLSGKNCVTYNAACDIVFEQLIPVNDWGRTFLVSSIAVQNYADIVTVIASQRTDVQYTTGGISSNMTLQEGKYSEIRLPSNYSLFISATQRIMVMYTFTGGNANSYSSDPFIMNVIPFESLSSSYVINTEIQVDNSIRVIAKMSNLFKIFSGNHVVSYTPAWNFINGTDYTWTDIALGSVNESFVLQHCSPFAAYIYGTGSWVGIGTTAPAINNIPDLGVTSLANGSIQANWTKIPHAVSYLVQLQTADNPSVLEEKIVNGSLFIFTGPYNYSVYNVTLWTMYYDEQCPSLEKQVIHFGKTATVIARAEVHVIGRVPIDENLIKDTLENEIYALLPPEKHQFVKVRVQPV